MQVIGSFSLTNMGGFDCVGKVMYIDLNGGGGSGTSSAWNMIPIDQTEIMNPKDRGVPDGSAVQIYFDIAAGNDRTGGTYFMYDANSSSCANYSISGTTFNSTINFNGVT